MKNIIILLSGKKRCLYSMILGIIAGIAMVFGYQLQINHEVFLDEALTWGWVLAASFVASFFFYLGFSIKCNYETEKACCLSLKWFSIICVGTLYLCWGIQLLGVYPGYFNYDAPGQWEMYALNQITVHHPVLHTLLVGKCLHLSFLIFKSSLPGVFLYILIQMFISGIAFTQVLRFMYKKRLPLGIIIFSLIWFACFPTVILSIMSVTKDSIFAPLLVSFVVWTTEIIEDQEAFFSKWYKMAAWAGLAVMMAVMRNNATYIAIPFFFVLLWVFRKYWKKYLVLLIGILALYGLYVGPFCGYFTVDGVASREFLSVPCQQMMRVYHNEPDLDREKKEFIETLFDEEALNKYVPKIADIAKESLDIDFFKENKTEVIKLWAELGLEYPKMYLDAFLEGNYGFWYPWATLTLYRDETEGYWVCRSYAPVWDESKIPIVQRYYKFFEHSKLVCENPLTMWVFAPGTYFWITLFLFAFLRYKRRKESIVFMFVLLIWLTFLLGPVALVRYVSFLYYLVPFEIGLFLNVVRSEKETVLTGRK